MKSNREAVGYLVRAFYQQAETLKRFDDLLEEGPLGLFLNLPNITKRDLLGYVRYIDCIQISRASKIWHMICC